MESEADQNPFLPPGSSDAGAFCSKELEREQQRRTYQLCRLGFGIQSVALALACVTSVLWLMAMFGGRALLIWAKGSAWWNWVDAPVVWASLIASYLFLGRWSERGWQRRAGLLLVMCMVDAGLWFLDHGTQFGLREPVGHEWLRQQLGQALGWAEFTLIAGLACDFMAHLGIDQAPEAGKATRSLSSTGAVIWLILFVERTAWSQGWPLQDHGIRSMETLLLSMGTHMIWTITLIQVTALTIAATRQGSRVLAEMDREDQQLDQFPTPPGRDDAFAAARDVPSKPPRDPWS
jgi:hypothetical protein